MKKAIVTFVQYYTYEIEVSDEIYENDDCGEAADIAYQDFVSDMCYPVANTCYDDVEVEFIEEEEEDEE